MKFFALLLLAALVAGCGNKPARDVHVVSGFNDRIFVPNDVWNYYEPKMQELFRLKGQPWNVKPAPTHTYIVWREDGEIGKRETVFVEDAVQTKSLPHTTYAEMLGIPRSKINYIQFSFVSGKNYTPYDGMRFFTSPDSAVAWIKAQQDTLQWHVALMSIVLDVQNHLCTEVTER